MSKYELKPFKKEHLSQLKVGPETAEMVNFIGVDAMAEGFQSRGPAYSAFSDGELFVISGINILWPGVGEAWAMFGVGYEEHGFFIHRTVIRLLNRLSDDLKLERLQAVVLKKHYAGVEWITRLGFDFEGTMEKYFHGNTYLRYAKLFDRKG